MRKFRGLAWITLAVLLLSHVTTANYEKGDYKIFALGDSKAAIKEKVAYLVSSGDLPKGNDSYFTTEIAGEEFSGYFTYYKDQLCRMSFYSKKYNASRYDTYLKDLMMDKIKPIFSGSYGNPSDDFGYPDFFEMKDGYTIFISKWTQENKETVIGISSGDFTYQGAILIIDKEIEDQKRLDEEKERQEQAKKAAGDF